MTDSAETPEQDETPMHIQHKIFAQAVFAALGFNEAIKAALQAAQLAEIDRKITKEGVQVAIFITHDGVNLKARMGLLAAGFPEPFETPMLVVQGPIDCAMAAPEKVRVTNLRKTN